MWLWFISELVELFEDGSVYIHLGDWNIAFCMIEAWGC